MNMFFLDSDLELSARYHNDKHVTKMPLEYAQLLSTAHHEHNSPIAGQVYKSTHKNHPCAVWVRSSAEAYNITLELFRLVSDEYTHRYGKTHKSYRELYELLSSFNPCPDVPATAPPQCMPDEYKADCHIQGYRNYYMGDKRGMASWSKRFEPPWWE